MSDLIERDKAIDAIKKLPNAGTRWIVSAESVFEVLMQLPSARPKAEWIKNIDGDYECSECHVAIRGDDKPIYPFCAWCGADMRGERSGTDKDKFEQ